MGRKRTPGLYKRRDAWHIDKHINGKRLCESTGTNHLEEAERYLARRVESMRQAIVYGIRQQRLFREAATKYLLENQHKRSIADDANHLKQADKFIGHLYLEQVHSGTLRAFIASKRADGRKCKTINLVLGTIRRVLNLAATEWLDENGLT